MSRKLTETIRQMGPIKPSAAKALMERRERMVTALAIFRPTPAQEQFFREMTSDVLYEAAVTGLNRGGKSMMVAAWFASLVMDIPITMRDGTKLHMRPERWRGQELLCWLVGYDWKHNGETLYRLLFRSSFKMIRDLKTNLWRSYDPLNPDDKGREDDCRPAPPLIPESAQDLDQRSWESRKDRQLQSTTLKKDGTRLVFYASTAECPAGNPVHAIWVDEKINDDSHYPEWQMRLVDFRGRILWSCWPTMSASGAFTALLDRANEEKDKPVRNVISVQLRKGDNPYTDNAARDYFLGTMSEEEASARGDGQSQVSRWLKYPQFNASIQRVMGNDPDGDDMLAKELRAKGSIPPEWTRYIIVDPGHQHCGVLLVAIPPPEFGVIQNDRGEMESAFVVPYREYDFERKEAGFVGAAVKAESAGEVFEDITCDAHAYRTSVMGMGGTTIGQIYEAGFSKAGLKSQRRGGTFSLGGDDTKIRRADLVGLMNIRTITGRGIGPGGKTDSVSSPRLRIWIDRCPRLVKQLSKFRLKADPVGQPTDEDAPYQRVDLAVCMEYAAIKRDLTYVPGRSSVPGPLSMKTVMSAFMKTMGIEKESKRSDGVIYCGAGRPV